MERPALLRSAVVFACVLAAGGGAVLHLRQLDAQERRRATRDLAEGPASAVEREFARASASASTLAALVAEGASESQLEGVATRLLRLEGGTATLQLARDGVITLIWPLHGNEAAVGLDLASHPLHAAQVRAAMTTGRPVMYGPFELVQGGAGFALRVPVMVGDGAARRPWGLSSAIVRLSSLVEDSGLARLEGAGLDWELSRAGDGAREVLAASGPGRALDDPESIAVQVPGDAWALSVAPRGGWGARSAPATLYLAALLLALVSAVLTYRIASLPAVLRREVAARTAELEVAHREQRRAEDAQRQSQKLEAVGLLAGGVAHDFNNLLAAILGYADVLAEEAAPGSVTEEAARTIGQAARRGADLTRQLLAFARLGRTRQEPVDVHQVVDEVAALLARTLDKSIRLVRRLEAPRHEILGDAGQLQQVVLNLAVNARDAMPDGGTLTLATAVQELDTAGASGGLQPGPTLCLSVTDTGVGIPRDRLERVFEPFFTTKPEGRGTGLGLSTVYGIVKAHGGAVRVYSEEGVGTRFLVQLPLLADAAAAPRAPAAEVTELPRGTGCVLVVDDEELVRRTAARMLAALGYAPVAVAGGGEALDWLAAQAAPPAAVLLDLAMPGLDGAACFRRLRARWPELRVVLTSGFARNARVQELLDAGAREFVQKPYSTAELARALAAAVRG